MAPKTCASISCKFKIRLKLRGKKLTQKQIETIISKGKSGEIKGFKSKKNDATYSMFVTLASKETGGLGFEYLPCNNRGSSDKPSSQTMPTELKL